MRVSISAVASPLCHSLCFVLQTFKPRPREPKKDKDKEKEKAANGPDAPASVAEHEEELDKPQQERKELQPEPTARPGDVFDAPANPVPAPSPTVKGSPALTADALPTLDLSNPDDVASLALSPVPGEEWIEPGVVVEKLAALLKVSAPRTSSAPPDHLPFYLSSPFVPLHTSADEFDVQRDPGPPQSACAHRQV